MNSWESNLMKSDSKVGLNKRGRRVCVRSEDRSETCTREMSSNNSKKAEIERM